jgi:glycosyltransferase involved in cell wall biosynthesis
LCQMKILAVHNRYQRPGGEDQVFVDETALLESRNHRVLRYEVHNDQVKQVNRLTLAKDTVWNTSAYRELGALIRRERPDVVHFHNTLPLVSPAGYYAARAEGVPVIQTLHNYRLLCPVALFFRDGGVCEDCMGKAVPWPGVVHRCYRGSLAASGVIATMLTIHRALRTWTEMVDVYVALTEFARNKFIEGGLPAGKIVVKPNFVAPDPGRGQGGGGYALFVGRLAAEKGTGTMLAAWDRLGTRIPLKIVGDGPLRDRVVEAAARQSNVEWLGHRPVEEVHALMGKADMLVFPSEWYETFGRVAVEAFAAGTPVIAANIGAVAELVEHGRTGLEFRPGDPEDLVTQVEWAMSHPAELRRMRDEVRAEFEAKYTAERNYRALMEIYEAALERKKVPA